MAGGIPPILTSTDNQFAPGTFVFEWSEDVVEDFGNVSDVNIDLPAQ